MTMFRRSMTGLTAAAVLIAASSTAFADGNRGNYRGWDNGSRSYRSAPQPQRHYSNEDHKKRDNAGKAVAIGIAAIMLGAILSQADRDRREYLNDH